MFPIINTIDDVLPAIQGRDEFLVINKDNLIFIDYCIQKPDTFIDCNLNQNILSIRRECRGITFDAITKRIVARKYHKFFNVNENEETQLHNIDISKPHVILDKLDGSLINIVKMNNSYQFHTKKGHTDVALDAEKFISSKEKEKYFSLCDDIGDTATALYEYISPSNRIVIKYDSPKLVLTAIRNNINGEYWNYNELLKIQDKYGIEIVNHKAFNNVSLHEIISDISNMDNNIEGFVLRFDDGQMYKMKTSLYVQLHKSKEMCRNEKVIWQMLLDGKLDDLKGYLSEEDLSLVSDFEGKFVNELSILNKSLNEFIKQARIDIPCFKNDIKEFKKIFATQYVLKYPHKQLHSLIMSNVMDNDCMPALIKYFRMHSHTLTQISNIRYLLNDVKYLPYVINIEEE